MNKNHEDKLCDFIVSTDDDSFEYVDKSTIHSSTDLRKAYPKVVNDVMPTEIQKELHFIKATICMLQSLLDANVQRLECQIESRFQDMENRLSTMTLNRNEWEDDERNIVDTNLKNVDQRVSSMEETIMARFQTMESQMKRVSIPNCLVPGFVDSLLTWRYQSSLGNYLTSNTFDDVTVEPMGAFQEWTCVPRRGSKVFLRNAHGSFSPCGSKKCCKLSAPAWCI